MPKVTSLGHLGFYVRDIERSVAFYRDILGLQVSDRSPRGAVFMTAQGRLAEHHELYLAPGRNDEGNVNVIQQISLRCTTLKDVKDFHRVFVDNKVPINRVVTHDKHGQHLRPGPRMVIPWKCIGRAASTCRKLSASRRTLPRATPRFASSSIRFSKNGNSPYRALARAVAPVVNDWFMRVPRGRQRQRSSTLRAGFLRSDHGAEATPYSSRTAWPLPRRGQARSRIPWLHLATGSQH